MLTLQKVSSEQAGTVCRLVHAAFRPLLEIYRDEATSPANKPLARFEQTLARPDSDGYLLMLADAPVGFVRVDRLEEGVYSLADLCILPDCQNRGLGQQALRLVEARYPQARAFCLLTIAQETRDCHLYEKLGYVCLGETQQVNARMTLVCYAKFPGAAAGIRLLQPDDCDAVQAMYADLHALHAQHRPDIYTPAGCFDRAALDALLSDSNASIFVADQNGRAVGLCVVKWRQNAPLSMLQTRSFAFIDDLYVSPDARRLGIGRQLMRAVRLFARARGMQSVELNVWHFNEDAIRFYQSLGFSCMRMQLEMKL